MTHPIFIRRITDDERVPITHGLRSSDACTLRRAQILLASAQGDTPRAIACQLHCGDQTVRNAIHAFNTRGCAALQRRSTAAPHVPHTAFDAHGVQQLPVLITRSPRTFGTPTSVWTRDLLAEVCFAERLTTRQVSGETIRATRTRLGIVWKRAKRGIRSPDPAYTRKKTAVIA